VLPPATSVLQSKRFASVSARRRHPPPPVLPPAFSCTGATLRPSSCAASPPGVWLVGRCFPLSTRVSSRQTLAAALRHPRFLYSFLLMLPPSLLPELPQLPELVGSLRGPCRSASRETWVRAPLLFRSEVAACTLATSPAPASGARPGHTSHHTSHQEDHPFCLAASGEVTGHTRGINARGTTSSPPPSSCAMIMALKALFLLSVVAPARAARFSTISGAQVRWRSALAITCFSHPYVL